MIDIKTLQNKKIWELSKDEIKAIQDAYLSYFDRCGSLKKRAVGYCVIVGGVPIDSIGDFTLSIHYTELDPSLPGGHGDQIGIGLNFGPLPVIPDLTDPTYNRLMVAIYDYIRNERRFADYIGIARPTLPLGGVRLPLFVATQGPHKGEPLKNCRTWMACAGKAIGFNASKLKLHTLGKTLHVAGGVVWEPGKPFKYKSIPLAEFQKIQKRVQRTVTKND